MLVSLELTGYACRNKWPLIEIIVNGKFLGQFEIIGNTFVDIEISKEIIIEKNSLKINYKNKTDQDTINVDGVNVEDQYLELHRCWIDHILCEPWLLTESYYYPEYFAGFLEFCPDAEKEIKSQLVWHFPGIFEICFPNNFWDWYCYERRKYALKANLDKDVERWENYTGNFELHQDVIDDIRKLING